MQGGKRLRAAFCLWAAHAARDGEAVPGVADAGAALEMFHLGALVHDDVMDRSDSRRGVPTAHRSFADRHRAAGDTGDAELFGTSVAVLVGDLCLTWADDLADRAVAAAGARGRRSTGDAARTVWETMRTQTMAGQYLDLLAQGRPGTPLEVATRVLHYKSAKYTVEHPLLLGAALAGASPALVAGYSAFGLRVGEAFQLRDDVLGVFGDARTTGKPSGDDVREGKRTVLVAYAEAAATPAQLGVLDRHLGDDGLDEAGLTAVREVLTDTGALGRVESKVRDLVDEAYAGLQRLAVSASAREALMGLTDASVWRTS
jgi:geranylgeranyl diphosphate synthase type I